MHLKNARRWSLWIYCAGFFGLGIVWLLTVKVVRVSVPEESELLEVIAPLTNSLGFQDSKIKSYGSSLEQQLPGFSGKIVPHEDENSSKIIFPLIIVPLCGEPIEISFSRQFLEYISGLNIEASTNSMPFTSRSADYQILLPIESSKFFYISPQIKTVKELESTYKLKISSDRYCKSHQTFTNDKNIYYYKMNKNKNESYNLDLDIIENMEDSDDFFFEDTQFSYIIFIRFLPVSILSNIYWNMTSTSLKMHLLDSTVGLLSISDIPPNMPAEVINFPLSILSTLWNTLDSTWFYDYKLPKMQFNAKYLLSFWLISDNNEGKVEWNFTNDIFKPYLYRFLKRLNLCFEFAQQSQVVNSGGIEQLYYCDKVEIENVVHNIMKYDDLNTFMQLVDQWSTRDVATYGIYDHSHNINIAAYIPVNYPLKIFDNNNNEFHSAFNVPDWGVFVTTTSYSQGGRYTYRLREHDAKEISEKWIANFRMLLSLPSSSLEPYLAAKFGNNLVSIGETLDTFVVFNTKDMNSRLLTIEFQMPKRSGVTMWEIVGLMRVVYLELLRQCYENLRVAIQNIKNLNDLPVDTEAATHIHRALTGLKCSLVSLKYRETCDNLIVGIQSKKSFKNLIIFARYAFQDSLAAMYDGSTIADSHFSLEFKYAVYFPFFMPILLPIILQLVRELKVRKSIKEVGNDKNK